MVFLALKNFQSTAKNYNKLIKLLIYCQKMDSIYCQILQKLSIYCFDLVPFDLVIRPQSRFPTNLWSQFKKKFRVGILDKIKGQGLDPNSGKNCPPPSNKSEESGSGAIASKFCWNFSSKCWF
jgi:hypothetical protein